LSALAIFPATIFLRAPAFNSRMSAVVHARLFLPFFMTSCLPFNKARSYSSDA
jgi:hypothetical protein